MGDFKKSTKHPEKRTSFMNMSLAVCQGLYFLDTFFFRAEPNPPGGDGSGQIKQTGWAAFCRVM